MSLGMRNRSVSRRVALRLLVVTTVFFGAACSGSSSSPENPQIIVAAASNLRPVFEDLAWQFTEDTGVDVVFTFGASGQLREQIINGAPFDVFAPADSSFVDDVIAENRAIAESEVDYAVGRLALWSAPDMQVPNDITQLADPVYTRIAIANPEIAPYGLAAQQALVATGVLPEAQSKLVFGESISDTKQIVDSGNAPVGIIALSLAIADGRKYVVIPDTLHEPLLQSIVITAKESRRGNAQLWIDYLSSDIGVQILEKYGFVRS